MRKKILFLGCGKLGTSIVNNLLKNNHVTTDDLTIIKPSSNNLIPNLKYFQKHQQLPQDYQADIVFICIKPQNAKTILSDFALAKIFNSNTVFISVLAGKKINFFSNFFSNNAQIIRTMPNIGVTIGKTIMPYFCSNVSDTNLSYIQTLFNSFGDSFIIDNEDDFHHFTALYGCGPALVFLLQEILFQIAIDHNINDSLARKLTSQLLLSSALLANNSDLNFSDLRLQVTSKKGVTEALLKNLIKNNKLKKLLNKAIDNAIKKSQKLAKNV